MIIIHHHSLRSRSKCFPCVHIDLPASCSYIHVSHPYLHTTLGYWMVYFDRFVFCFDCCLLPSRRSAIDDRRSRWRRSRRPRRRRDLLCYCDGCCCYYCYCCCCTWAFNWTKDRIECYNSSWTDSSSAAERRLRWRWRANGLGRGGDDDGHIMENK